MIIASIQKLFILQLLLLQSSNIFRMPAKNDRKHLAISALNHIKRHKSRHNGKSKMRIFSYSLQLPSCLPECLFPFLLFVALWLKSIYYKVILFTLSFLYTRQDFHKLNAIFHRHLGGVTNINTLSSINFSFNFMQFSWWSFVAFS